MATGLETDLKPWIIPDDAFAQLNNSYVFRGRVRKRFGSYLMNGSVNDAVAQQHSRLRINIGVTPGPINIPGTATQLQIGQMFSVGDDMFTIWQLGAGVTTLSTNPLIVAVIDSTVNPNTVTFVGAVPATAVYYYPANPVMGLITYDIQNINDEPTYAFDTQFAYEFVLGGWERLGTAIWTGNDSQLFWGYTYRGVNAYDRLLFVTNFNAPDLIKYWDGAVWTDLHPVLNTAGDTLETCRIIVGFKNRLLALNTVEKIGGINRSFVNRCRYSVNGDPTNNATSWNASIPGQGSFIDNQATEESIITVEFLKDRLIVFYERSTWELVYTGNDELPFTWQQINTELGAESTFSVVPFDKVTLGIGNVGIHACNGSNVERIDDKIPTAVFEIANDNQGVFRVYGIRDYFVEMVYWTFPDPEIDTKFPNRVLVYNYKTGSWAFNDDSITAFGYFQNVTGLRWQDIPQTWQESIESWNSATLQSKFRQVIAGNQEGFTFIIDPDSPRNAPVLSITNITYPESDVVEFTVINHNLQEQDFITLENLQGVSGPIHSIFQIAKLVTADPTNKFQIFTSEITGVYTGGGTIARVSRIDILTKQFNPYIDKDRNVYVAKVDFYVDKTEHGAITVDYFPSATTLSMIDAGVLSTSIMGTSMLETTPYALYPLEQVQERLWHPVYLQTQGETIQLHLYINDEQMLDFDIMQSDFELHAMTLFCQPTTARLE